MSGVVMPGGFARGYRRPANRWAVGITTVAAALTLSGVYPARAEEATVTVRTLPPRKPGQTAPARPASTGRETTPAAQGSVQSRTAGSRSTWRAPETPTADPADQARQAQERARRTAAARARERAQRLTRAREAERRRALAASRSPSGGNAFNTDTPAAALPKAMDNPRERSAAELNSQGHRLLLRGQFAQAEPLLRRAISGRPSNPTYSYALYNLGWSLMAQGKASEAIRPLRRSAELQPERWEPVERLAEAYKQAGWKDHAEETYARARELRAGRRRGSGAPSGLGAAIPAARKPERGAFAPAAGSAVVASRAPVKEMLGEAYVGVFNPFEERAAKRMVAREAQAGRVVPTPPLAVPGE